MFLRLILAVSLCVVATFAAIPQQINYQGSLTSPSGTPLDTTVTMTFKLYTDSTAGALLWTEARPFVTVTDGLFSVQLGQETALTDAILNQSQVWLGLIVGADAEMTPRTRIVSVAYSYRTGTVDAATGGVLEGDISVGRNHTRTGLWSFANGDSNTVLGNYSSVGGRRNRIHQDGSFIGGGQNNIADGTSNAILIGENNQTFGDDGVIYLNQPWMPCTHVQAHVMVTAGGAYADYAGSGGLLYLNGWKDGNLDGDFCDILCDNAAEWIVRDEVVTPGAHLFTFLDPGVFDMNEYDGVLRWRLSSRAMGPNGFGLIDAQACPSMVCGLVGLDFLGEVEDYVVEDLQLSVELLSFEAVASDGQVALRWTTASETNHDRFDVLRDGTTMAQVPSLGNGASGHSYSWTDHGLVNGTAYTYSLVAVDIGGQRDILATQSATPQAAQITEYALTANYPNPFNPTTSFGYSLKEAGLVNLKVFDLSGRLVKELVNGEQPIGRYSVSFDGAGLPSGVYYYRLIVNGFSATQKMVLMK